jgi:dihydroxy-acid dehydratase
VLQWYDGLVTLPGCDKNMPGALIAMARLDRPSIMVYGGTIRPGVSKLTGEPLDIVSAFQSFGAFSNDKINEEQRFDMVHRLQLLFMLAL